MESTHGELGTRFTNRLRSDHAHCFADIDQVATAQVAPITLATEAEACFTGQRGAHFDLIDAQGFDGVAHILGQQCSSFKYRFLRFRVDDIADSDASEYPLAQGFDHFAAFDQRLDHQTIPGAAIFLDHDQILGYINQATRQVTRVRGFQRRIGQAFTCTVGRDEVLQHVQAFTEVRRDRGFNNGTVWLCHQASHTGQLTNLGCRSARARVCHHVNRIERFLADFLAVTVSHFFGTQLPHHGLGDGITCTAPNIHDLVVALALSHQT